MKKFTYCIFFLIVFFSSSLSFANDERKISPLWPAIYSANWSLAQKQILCLPQESIDDAVISSLLFAYLYHRMGDIEKKEEIFKSLDKYLSHPYS